MPAKSKTLAAIDRVFADWNRADRPGLSVGIVCDGKPIYTRSFGLANVEHRAPNTPETLFNIASVTKQFTALTVLLLAEDGVIRLGDPIRRYIPELPDYDPPVLIRHCLYHTSGLTDWIEALELAGPAYDYCTTHRALRTIATLDETMFPAGSEHSYCNSGYVLLACIVARVSGRSFANFLKERIFAPLAMRTAGFLDHPEGFLPDQAQGYYREEDGTLCRVSWPCDVCGDGGMFASITDLIRWLQSFTEEGSVSHEMLPKILAPGFLDTGRSLRYAAGWEIDHYRGTAVFRHGGMGPGFQSHIVWCPDARLGIAILGNLLPCGPWMAANEVLDLFLNNRSATTTAVSSEIQTAERAELEGYLGRYFTATGLPVFVTAHADSLMIDIWLWRRPFVRYGDDTFIEGESGDAVTFHRAGDGGITHFTMTTTDGASPRMHSPIRHAVKYEPTTVDSASLRAFEGHYISDALGSLYRIDTDEGGLVARHARCSDWRLQPIKPVGEATFGDEFAQELDWPGKVAFLRDAGRNVEGFRVLGKRFNVKFHRLPI